jgi:hypothetical protein
MPNETRKLRSKFKTAKILADHIAIRAKLVSLQMHVTFTPEPESFMAFARRRGIRYNGANAGRGY